MLKHLIPEWEFSTIFERGSMYSHSTIYLNRRPTFKELLDMFEREKDRRGMIGSTFGRIEGRNYREGAKKYVVTDDPAELEECRKTGTPCWFYPNRMTYDMKTFE